MAKMIKTSVRNEFICCRLGVALIEGQDERELLELFLKTIHTCAT